MAIFNESFLDRFFKKKKKKSSDKSTSSSYDINKDRSSEKEKGLLTKEDIQDGIAILNKVVKSDPRVGKYLYIYPIEDIMKIYSKTAWDDAFVGMVEIMDPDDKNNQDVLVPHEDSPWFHGDFKKISDQVDDMLYKLDKKLEKECEKYKDRFEFDTDRDPYYNHSYYICSNKPKEGDK